MEQRRVAGDNASVAVLLVLVVGLFAAAYLFGSWQEKVDKSSRLLSQASYIQGQIDATPGPPDQEKTLQVIDLIIAARPDIVDALASMSEDESKDKAVELAFTVFPGKPYTAILAASSFLVAAQELRTARRVVADV
jgi:hypothetical protein